MEEQVQTLKAFDINFGVQQERLVFDVSLSFACQTKMLARSVIAKDSKVIMDWRMKNLMKKKRESIVHATKSSKVCFVEKKNL